MPNQNDDDDDLMNQSAEAAARLTTDLDSRAHSAGGAVQIGMAGDQPLWLADNGTIAVTSNQGKPVPYYTDFQIITPRGSVIHTNDVERVKRWVDKGATINALDGPVSTTPPTDLHWEVTGHTDAPLTTGIPTGTLDTNLNNRAHSAGGATQIGTTYDNKPLWLAEDGTIAVTSDSRGKPVGHYTEFRITRPSGAVTMTNDADTVRQAVEQGATVDTVAAPVLAEEPRGGHNTFLANQEAADAFQASNPPTANSDLTTNEIINRVRGIATAHGEVWSQDKVNQIVTQIERNQRSLESVEADVTNRLNSQKPTIPPIVPNFSNLAPLASGGGTSGAPATVDTGPVTPTTTKTPQQIRDEATYNAAYQKHQAEQQNIAAYNAAYQVHQQQQADIAKYNQAYAESQKTKNLGGTTPRGNNQLDSLPISAPAAPTPSTNGNNLGGSPPSRYR